MGNTAENRRNLRSDLERQAVERCEDFVRQMAPMRDMLRQAEANADLLDRQAQASVEDLEKTDAETRRVVAAHEQLLATRDQLQREHDAAVAFRARYELSPNEKAALEAPNVYEERGGDADELRRRLAEMEAAMAAEAERVAQLIEKVLSALMQLMDGGVARAAVIALG